MLQFDLQEFSTVSLMDFDGGGEGREGKVEIASERRDKKEVERSDGKAKDRKRRTEEKEEYKGSEEEGN